jgi:acyl-CoA synthetase (AMP-forming)/AMP-acid ligase II
VSELEWNLIHRINVGDALVRTAARHPHHQAVIDGDRRFTYAELDAWVSKVANALATRGYKRGDALSVMAGNCVEFLVTYYACAKLGVVCVPINLGWLDTETSYVLNHAKARGMVTEQQQLAKARAALANAPDVKDLWVIGESFNDLSGPVTPINVLVEDRDPITYLYTSGTTAAPKGVVGSHLAIHVEALTVAIDMELHRRDRMLCVMPMFHTAQLNAFCTPAVTVGATMVILRAFDAERVLELVAQERLTVLFALPMMYRALVELQKSSPRVVKSLRLCVYAMTPMPDVELRAALEAFNCDFALMFGQTEMSPVATFFRPEHQLSHIGAVGTPSVNVQVAIMADDGTLVPPGDTGEIVYRSPHAAERYLDDGKASDTAFRHGWFHSGDNGHLGDDGMLWFEDRVKDVIKSGGENVASIEVEKMVYEVAPSVAQAVVIGLPHAHWIEAITVIAVPRAGATVDPDDLIAKLKPRLASFKVPKAVIVVGAMPMTSTGKIQKHVLRQRHAKHYDGK